MNPLNLNAENSTVLWVDAQLSPHLALWIQRNFDYPCFSVRYLGLRDADDEVIFQAARQANATVITKDEDFVRLLNRFHAPPRIIWLTCGNTSNQRLREIFDQYIEKAIDLLQQGADLVEITG